MEQSLTDVTDTQILHLAQRILGDVPMRIVRSSSSLAAARAGEAVLPYVYLVARIQDSDHTWRVRFSSILPDQLAFDRIM